MDLGRENKNLEGNCIISFKAKSTQSLRVNQWKSVLQPMGRFLLEDSEAVGHLCSVRVALSREDC